MATDLFPGALGEVRTIEIKKAERGATSDRSYTFDIPSIVLVGLLEDIRDAFKGLANTQEGILLELRKHTDALQESVERELKPI